VRVRDPFGSLSRTKLLEAPFPSARIDQTAEGRGLCSPVTGIRRRDLGGQQPAHRRPGRHHRWCPCCFRPFAFHLLFKDSARRRFWKTADQDTAVSEPSMNTFVSIVIATDPK